MISTRHSERTVRHFRTVAILAVLALAGCTAPGIRPVALPLPPRPVLTPIKGDALQCLAPSTYTTIVERERALRTWGLEMEAIIGANNAKAKP